MTQAFYDPVAVVGDTEGDMSPLAAVPIDHGMFRTDTARSYKDRSSVICLRAAPNNVARILHLTRPTSGP